METRFPVLHLPTPSLIPLSPPPFPFFSLPVACCLLPLPHSLLSHAPPPLLIPELITPAILPASRDRLCNDPFLLFLAEKEQGSYRQHEHHVFAWRGSAVLTTQSQLDNSLAEASTGHPLTRQMTESPQSPKTGLF